MTRANQLMAKALIAIPLSAASAPFAMAQDAASEQGLQDIVVTARRVSENLQDVPISVGAINEQGLQARGIFSLTEIRSAIANVTISKIASAGGNYISIRGITGTSIPNVSVDSNIGFYIDGVYFARAQGSGGDVADLERVEVLRGPQGTLSGRNSAAGAINFVTASPAGEFGVIAEGTIGNFGRRRGRMTVNTPDFNGLSARLTYIHDQNSGTIRNRASGVTFDYGPEWGRFTSAKRADSLNSDVILAKLRYEGIDNFVVDYKFDFSDQKEVFPAVSVVGFPTSAVGVGAANLYLAQPAGAIPLFRDRPAYANLDMLSPGSIRSSGHLLTANLDVSDSLAIKSITAYRKLDVLQQADTDRLTLNVPLCVACGLLRTDQNQFSQEIQLLGTLANVKYIFGGYYFREKAFGDNPFALFKSLVPVNGIIPIGVEDYRFGNRERAINKSYAAYGHLDIPIFDKLEVALGARYTRDSRVNIDTRPQFAAPIRDEIDFGRFNFDVALTYAFTPDIRAYTRYATGYQSGGIIKGAIFQPEDHKALEIGFKSELFDRRLRLNAAYFHTDVKNLQRTSTGPIGLIVENFTNVKIDGIEVELLAVPIRGLTIGVNYGYNNLKSAFQDVPTTPRTTTSFNAQFDTVPFDNGSFLSFRVDGDYRSRYYGIGQFTQATRTANPAFPLPAQIWQAYPSQQAYIDDIINSNRGGGYWMANARISINDLPLAGTTARLAAYVYNITDVEGRNYTVNNGLFLSSYERPMTFGVELGLKF